MQPTTDRTELLLPLRCGLRLLLCSRSADGDYPEMERDTLLVIDDRAAKDPSFRIVDSYRIVHRRQRLEILQALLDYAATHPAEGRWQRTLASMEKEWVIHNVAYRFRLFPEQTRDVDLNNGEENSSWRHFFRRGVGMLKRRALRLLQRK